MLASLPLLATEIGAASLITAFAAGVVSVLSPCVLPLMPAYLSLVSGLSVEEMRGNDERAGQRRAVLIGAGAFVLGFSAVFVLLGASAAAVGPWLRRLSLDIGPLSIGIAQLAGLLILLMGLHVAGWVRIPALYRDQHFEVAKARGPVGAALIGGAFAFGWTPCVGPILGGILTLAGSRDTVGSGMALLTVYSLGLGIPFMAAAWSFDFFLAAIGRMRRHFRALEIASGSILILVGFLVLTNQLTRLNGYFSFLERIVMQLEDALL